MRSVSMASSPRAPATSASSSARVAGRSSGCWRTSNPASVSGTVPGAGSGRVTYTRSLTTSS